MQFSNAGIIAVKESVKVFRQIAFIFRRKRTNDTEIHRHVLRLVRVTWVNENIPRMHVRVEKVMPKHLGKKHFHPQFAQAFKTDIEGLQSRNIANGHTVNTFHHHDVLVGVIPMDFRYIQGWIALEIAPNLAGIGGFAD